MGCRSPPGWRACKSSQLLRAFKAQRVSWEGASAGCWLCTAFCQASGDSTSCSPACGSLDGGSRRVAGYHGFEIQATSYGKVQVQHWLCLPLLPPTPSCGDRPAVSRGTQLFGGLRQSGDAGGVMGVKCQEKSKGSAHPRAPGEPGHGQCPVPSGA